LEHQIKSLEANKGKLAVLAAAAAMSYFFLGLSAARAIIGISIFWILPAYILMSSLNLKDEEKLALSFFAGIVIIPSLVYWLAFVLPFRASIYVVTGSLLAVGVYLTLRRKKEEDAKTQQN